MKKLLEIITLLLICVSFVFNPGTADAEDITLRWDPNSEPDLGGYKIYYKVGSSGVPCSDPLNPSDPGYYLCYDNIIVINTVDPSDPNYMDNNAPEWTITDLPEVQHFIVVTAFDVEVPENESGYSNEVTSRVILTLAVVGNGNITAVPPGTPVGVYKWNEQVTLTPNPDADYLFSRWSGSHTGTEDPLSITMNSDKTITATFTEISAQTYRLTVNTVGRGTVSPTGGEYVADTVVPVTATAAPGWEFKEWLNADDNLIGNLPVIDITMDGPIEITAVFENTPLAPPGGLSLEILEP